LSAGRGRAVGVVVWYIFHTILPVRLPSRYGAAAGDPRVWRRRSGVEVEVDG